MTLSLMEMCFENIDEIEKMMVIGFSPFPMFSILSDTNLISFYTINFLSGKCFQFISRENIV